MNYESTFFHCSDHLKETFHDQVSEIREIIDSIHWQPEFHFLSASKTFSHQAAYNEALKSSFSKKGWEVEPVLVSDLKFKGDFRKHLVFVEVQFGNSAALYRDYYKFQYGLANGLLSLAVLIVPLIPEKFFPTRPSSVRNMADYRLAMKCFTMLPIRVPTLLIGLIPKN